MSGTTFHANENDLEELMETSAPDINQWSERNLRAYELVLKHYLKYQNFTAFKRTLHCVGPSFLSRPHLPSKVSLGRYYLSYAVENRDVDLVKHLVERGSDVRELHKGQTVLHLAVGLGNIQMVEILVQVGADLHQVDVRGNSVLFAAIDSKMRNKVDVIHWLINNGIDLSKRNHAGRGPLHVAATSSPDLVSIFVRAGCLLTAQDVVNGYLPLHCACARSCPDAAAILLSLGANVNSFSFKNETPLLVLLKPVENYHDFHSKTRLRFAKSLVQLGGHLGFLNNVKFVKNAVHRKSLVQFHSILQGMRQINSLQHLSRLVIRRQFENGDLQNVKNLPIPENLKEYILFGDNKTVEFLKNMADSKSSNQSL